MKIGFFTDSYLPTVHGVQISLDTFQQCLEELGHEVFIYAPCTPGYKDANPRIFRLESVRVIEKPEMRFAFPIRHGGKFRKMIQNKLDIVHTHSPFSLGFLGKFVAEYQGIPMVYTHHTHYPEYVKSYMKEKLVLPFLAKGLSTLFSNASNAVIAPSYKIKTLLKDYGVTRPIHVLPTGIHINSFTSSAPLRAKAQAIRERLGIRTDKKVLMFVGRMGKEKNVDFLLKAFADIHRKHNDVNFLMVGAGPHLKNFEATAKKLGIGQSIFFTGPVNHADIPAYYHASDLFVFASLTDTQGIVILEAAASGLPVVALADDALKGALLNGENGYSVKADSPAAFAKKVLEIVNNKKLHEKFSRASIRIARNFTEMGQAKKLVKIYEDLIAQYR